MGFIYILSLAITLLIMILSLIYLFNKIVSRIRTLKSKEKLINDDERIIEIIRLANQYDKNCHLSVLNHDCLRLILNKYKKIVQEEKNIKKMQEHARILQYATRRKLSIRPT